MAVGPPTSWIYPLKSGCSVIFLASSTTDSRLRDVMVPIYTRMFGKEPKVLAIHAGLECGLLGDKLPGLDCGSCGAPTCKSLAEDIVRGEAVESDCVYYLRENLHKLSEEVSILADDIAAGNAEGYEMLKVMTEYIQRISDEMSLLDSRDEKEKDQE